MKVLLVVAALVVVALAQTTAPYPPAPPTISEVFTAVIDMTFENNTHFYTGEARQANDQTNNRAVFDAHLGGGAFVIYELLRYDLGQLYKIDSVNTTCIASAITGSLPLQWAWLANSTYTGNMTINNVPLYIFNTTLLVNSIEFRTAAGFFIGNNIAAPAIVTTEWRYNGNFERRTLTYREFAPKVNPDDFRIPNSCPQLVAPQPSQNKHTIKW